MENTMNDQNGRENNQNDSPNGSQCNPAVQAGAYGKYAGIPRKLWTFAGLSLLCLTACAAYVITAAQMSGQGSSYRSWIQLLFYIGIGLLLPTLLFGTFSIAIRYLAAQGMNRNLYVVMQTISAVLYGIFMLAACLVVLVKGFLLETERRTPEGFLVGEEESWDSHGFTTYYTEYDLFTRKEYVPTAEIVRHEMERKYGLAIEIAPESLEKRGIAVTYHMKETEETGLIFRANPYRLMTFEDDYVQVRADRGLREAAALICPWPELRSGSFEEDISIGGLMDTTVLVCMSREDALECAKAGAALIERVLQDPFYEKWEARLSIRCIEGSDSVEPVELPFGGEAGGRYADWSLIYKKLLDQYEWNGTIPDHTAEEGETVPGIVYETSPFYVEGAYKVLYDTLFAPEGFPYETTYNAKGNFYAVLGESSGMITGSKETYDTRETVVYDRESKNGKCHLFVHYMEYYKQASGDQYTTGIVDMYAVDMSTGEVYKSGRKAWADVGSSEYCEATGEP